MTQFGSSAADFSDARVCLNLIAALPLANPAQAHRTLHRLLADMHATPPPAADYLDVLETARSAVAFAQDELAQRYAGKPLAPTAAEDATFHSVVGLWQAMARAYADVARLGGDAAIEQRLALICQRCLHYSGHVVLEYFRARREPAPGAWIDLHGYFDTAEEWGLTDIVVAEPLNDAPKSQRARDAYAAVLLADLANPYGRSSKEIGWIFRWAQRFAPLVDLQAVLESDDGRAYGVDLMTDAGVRPLNLLAHSRSVRRLLTTRLATELQRIVTQLKQGTPPVALGLGNDCIALTAGQLLVFLYRFWCLHARPRRFQRREAAGVAHACYGFEAIHYRISGTEFNQPQHVRMYSRADMESIWTFRDQIDPTQQLALRAARIDYPMEKWDVADQSVNGFRLRRGTAGARIEHGQLLGIRPPDGGHYLLAQISWHLMQAHNGELVAGIHVLPGLPQGVALRPVGADVSPSERYIRAFLLPAAPLLKEGPSLVTPRGWFQPERVVEVYVDRQLRLRFTELLGIGSDFERVGFTPL